MESDRQSLGTPLLDELSTDSPLTYFASDNECAIRPRRRLRFDRHKKVSLNLGSVRAYSMCEKFEINDIFLSLSTLFTNIAYKSKLSREVAVVVLNDDQHIFFFDFGAVVFWAFPTERTQKIIECLHKFTIKPHHDYEVETLGYEDGERFQIYQDVVELGNKDIYERLAVSYAMAQVTSTQSAQLAQYENDVNLTIDSTEKIQNDLAERGEILLSQKEITKKIGQLFRMRAVVNLQSELLDTPDCFWEDDEMERVYLKSKSYLDMDKRLKILNHRLQIIKELLDLMNDELHSKHGSNLELIIIWLIVVEVVCYIGWQMLVKDIFGYFKG